MDLNTILQLAQDRDRRAIPGLIGSLAHESWVVRRYQAVDALRLIGSSAIDALRQAVTLTNRGRALAAYALMRINPSDTNLALQALTHALQDPDWEVRQDSVWALGNLQSSARPAVPDLLKVLNDSDECVDVRIECARSLATIAEPARLIAACLAKALDDPATWLRVYSLWAISDLGRAAGDIVPAVVEHLQHDPEPDVRLEATRALAAAAAPATAVAGLVRALGDSDEKVRIYAARSMAKIEGLGTEALCALSRALHSGGFNLARNATAALARICARDLSAIPHLLTALNIPEVAGIAAEALAMLDAQNAETLLAKARTADVAAPFAAYALTRVAATHVREELAKTGITPFIPCHETFFLLAPNGIITERERARFEDLLNAALRQGPGTKIEYREDSPVHRFLSYVTDVRGLVLHGSNKGDMDLLSPIRWSTDTNNLSAVHGTTDAIWAIYFAVLKRDGLKGPARNGFFPGRDYDGIERKFYHFSLIPQVLRRCWTEGTVYILPKTTFRRSGIEWVSQQQVYPVAKLSVRPDDFPYLHQVRGHEWRKEERPPGINLEGTPFLDDVWFMPWRPTTYSIRFP